MLQQMEEQNVRFLVVSDTHDLELSDTGPFRRDSLSQVDVLIHCGDLTDFGTPEALEKAVELLKQVPAELRLLIPGNHDISLDKDYFISQGGSLGDHERATELISSLKADGITYLHEGTHEFKLQSGARMRIYASPYTPHEYSSPTSAFQYATREDRFTLPHLDIPAYATRAGSSESNIPKDVDIVVTHGPPKYILDQTQDGRNIGCEHLSRAVAHSRPLMHCFGHAHSGWGLQRVVWRSALEQSQVEELQLDPFGSGDGDFGSGECIKLRDFVSRGQARKRGFAEAGLRHGLGKSKQTLFVNAAVGFDGEGRPGNPPWLVTLPLRK